VEALDSRRTETNTRREALLPIPDFQSLMLPMLELAADGKVHSLESTRQSLAGRFGLTADERAELLPSGRQHRFDNRVAWAKVYLERAGLLSSPKRAHFEISEDGRKVLAEKPKRVDILLLSRFEKFREFRKVKKDEPTDGGDGGTDETPEEILEQAYQGIRQQLAVDLLEHIKAASPQFFESLVVDLLLKMGYGGNRVAAGKAIGKSGDEGIDGVISEDRLGLDQIYVQAKRWEGTVGRPEVHKFVGALQGQRAHRGVLITTSTFSQDAKEYVKHIESRVVLIDGRQMAEYMIDLNLGVTSKACYDVKRIDLDYFEEE